ncbi:uncharacterized protein LOC111618501 [Centruroides sculpturatus]|uniref:uncharacterized protein LOC111618501 n=1 Tax=Centruroides sculpturatus TaxID=218467 RepID=UPI000C6CEB3D|nr:uncharacterized protein LOC111618501 [Centruroides sculpturatus]
MDTRISEAFLDEAYEILDEVKGYFVDNPTGRLGTREHMRYITKQITKIINLAESKLRDNDISNILERKLDALATKQDLQEATLLQNEKTMEAISNVKEEISTLSKALPTESPIEKENPVPSYSDVLKQGNKQPQKDLQSKPEYTVLVYSKDKESSSEQTKALLTSKVRPKTLGIGVKRVRKIKNGGVAIDLCGWNDMAILSEALTKVKEFETIEKKRNLPLVKIVSVPKSITKESLLENIFEQNFPIACELTREEFDERIKIKFPINQRNTEYVSWVLEVAVDLREIMQREGKINLGWTRCPVFDYILVKRCYKCLAFGHFARDCRSEKNTCSHCGEAHLFKNCKKKEEIATCANCVRQKRGNHDHNTLDKRCPIYLQEVEKIIKRTND